MTGKRILIATSLDSDGIARMPRILAGAGALIDVVCPSGFKIVSSRYVGRHFASEFAAERILAQTRALAGSGVYDEVILGCDPLLYAVYGSHDNAWAAPYLPAEPERFGALLADKNEFLRGCTRAGIAVPSYAVCADFAEAAAAAKRIGYPVMIKLGEGYSGLGVRAIRDETDLCAAFDQGFVTGTFAIQQRIEGTVGTTAVLFQAGVPLFQTSAYYERSWPTPFHPPTVRRITNHDIFLENACKVGAMLGYRGFGGIDWIEEASTGKIYVLELNARPMPMHVIAPAMQGWMRALRALFEGSSHTPRLALPEGLRYYAFPNDLYRVVDELDFGGMLRWLFVEPLRGAIPFDDLPLVRMHAARMRTWWGRKAARYPQAAAARLKKARLALSANRPCPAGEMAER